ncbi:MULTISPECIES: amidohydrolase [unclassified Diaminobutyricimonas]|uniref:amidohydrolase family protein n=1 Tax=unclassified Diaminobutyricimonas TaxID=2643261 RepID=UPI0012F4AFBC|nr:MULTISPECIES: amidohydrolase [unclassified Diaminobutyricimonas]
MGSIAIEGGCVITGDEDRPWIDDGHILVRDGVIVSVGAGAAPSKADERIDAGGMLVSPGFVNGHTHLSMTLGRTLGVDESLLGWLAVQQPITAALEPEDVRLAVQLGALENLKAGNTTVCEVFSSTRFADGVDAIAAEAIDEFGLRSVFFRCSNDLPFGGSETLDEIERRTRDLINAWANSSRIQIGVGPKIPWAASRDYWHQTREFVAAGTPAHLHTSETPEYNDLVRAKTGMSNVELLADVGVLGPAVMLNHCVHLSDRDIGLISDHGSPVIHDPVSNMFLASGVAPIVALRDANVVLGLACDGAACNNTQDMFEVMKAASLLQKAVTRDPKALTAQDVFTMATSGGAAAAGLGKVTGRLAPGYAADVVLIDTDAPHLTPIHDPLAALVYSARAADVHTVLVDGKVVLANRTVPGFDEGALLARARERGAELRALAGI